jgi:hypothetical protein
LYARSRRAPSAVAAVLVTSTLVWVLARLSGSPGVEFRLAVLGLAVVAAVTATGLSGADPMLDRTAATNWSLLRVAHLAVVAVLGTVAALPVSQFGIALRDAVGLTGLAAVGVTLLGVRFGWLVPVVWAAVSMMITQAPDGGLLMAVATWPASPSDRTATLIGMVLGLGGGLAYVLRGPRLTGRSY